MTKRDLEEREQEILREAKEDDASELGEKDSLLFAIREKDAQIAELKKANENFAAYFNTSDSRQHPQYKELMVRVVELEEALAKTTKLQPASDVKSGGLGA